jgi:phosphatidylserine decarboxylase
MSREEQKELSYDEQVKLINARIQIELADRTIKKGDMISSFLFGVSDLLMLFERQANIKILAEVGRHDPVRSPIGMANIEKLLV